MLLVSWMGLESTDLDLSKEVLWVSVGQLAAKLEDDPFIWESNLGRSCVVQDGLGAEFFQTSNFESL